MRGAAGACPEEVELGGLRVADDDRHVVEAHPELVRRHLGERRLVPLAVRHLRRDHGHVAVRLEPHARRVLLHREADRRPPVGKAGRRLDRVREAKAEVAALLTGAALLLPEPLVVDVPQKLVERLDCGRPVHRRSARHLPGHLLGGQQVAAPHFDRVEAELARDDVHHALADEGLGGSRPAVRDVGVLVRRHDRGVEGVGIDPQRGQQGRAGERREDGRRRHRGIGTVVHRHLDADAEDGAVVLDGELDIERLLASGAAHGEVLVPVLDPLDGAAQHLGGGRDRNVFAVDRPLESECAADVLAEHAGAVLRHVDELRQVHAVRVRGLRGGVVRELVGRAVVVRDPTARLHGHESVPVLVQRRRHHPVGRRERAVDVAVAVAAGRIAMDDVVAEMLEDERRVRRQPGLGRGDDGQLVVVDEHEVARILGDVARLGDHDCHRVADEADLVGCERRVRGWPVPVDGEVEVEHAGDAVEVLRQEDGDHARQLPRLRRIDGEDLRVGERAADERRVQHPRQRDVVHVLAAPREDARILAPLDAAADELPDHPAGRHDPPPSWSFCEASFTPSTMLW